MKFNSQICTTKEQSQRLLELGLKPETADCYNREEDYGWSNWIGKPSLPTDIPAWSLHRLLCLYGQDYEIKEVYNNAEECYGMLICAIEIAIENGEFNKEYLKQ